MSDPRRTPVIIGVGQCNDRPATGEEGLDSLDLMEHALRAAEADAGGRWLAGLDSLAVVDQISFPQLGNVSSPLAQRLGAGPKICHQTEYPFGTSPILLLNEAANRIAGGEVRVAAIVGGEALRTAARRAAPASDGAPRNLVAELSRRRTASYARRYGLITPTDGYPLYENACRAAYGQTLAEGQRETGDIWSRFSEAAVGNPGAWIRRFVTAEAIITPSPENRLISFPYTKLMVANSSVNQGAGFLVTSLALARARGVPDDRILYVGPGAAADERDSILERDGYADSVAMRVSIRRALDLNALSVDQLDFVELYSCFPCIPKMARRTLGWPVERPASVAGGLTFGGGPLGNYMSHAVAAMVLRLRERGKSGLLFANGGIASHYHTIVISRIPPPAGAFPQSFDYNAEANAARGPIPPIVEDYTGPGRIETYTVLYDRGGSPRMGVIVARTPDGARFLAKVPAEDEGLIAFLTDGRMEPVGSCGDAVASVEGLTKWRRR